MTGSDTSKSWIDLLSAEDVMFIKRFVLFSGSLKKLAAAYGVSYPTVRLRLDRMIAKIEVLDGQTEASEFERVTRALYAERRLDKAALETLLEAHRREIEEG